MKTLIISAFPGTGKSYCIENRDDLELLDSDSSKFSWKLNSLGNKIRNEEFPKNYVDYIKSTKTVDVGKAPHVVFVSTHEEVRKELRKRDIKCIFVYPDIKLKSEYVKRYRDRGSSEQFIKQLYDNWEKWIVGLKFEKGKYYVLKSGEYLYDILDEIIKEN
jgi:hypothetical protein